MSETSDTSITRYPLSPGVADLPRSVAFYERVFRQPPQTRTATDAKFDLREPALNFSLVQGPPSKVGHLSREGLLAGEEPASTCCYARQDKRWLRDPDDNPWEGFLVHKQLPLPGPGAPPEGTSACGGGSAAGSTCCA